MVQNKKKKIVFTYIILREIEVVRFTFDLDSSFCITHVTVFHEDPKGKRNVYPNN